MIATHYFLITGKGEDAVFTEYDPATTPEYKYPISLFYQSRYDDKLELYRNETGKFEKITKIKREETPFTLKKQEIAHRKYSAVEESVRLKYFPHKSSPFHRDDDQIEELYALEYSEEDIEKKLSRCYSIKDLFLGDTMITVTTASGELSFKENEIEFISTYAREDVPSNLIVDVTKDFLNIIINYKSYAYSSGGTMSDDTKTRKMMLNMKTGITNYFAEGSNAFTNATTGEIGNDILNVLTGAALDKVIEIISDYNKELNGIRPECIKLKTSAETLKSFNFNPYCNPMYLYKPFFNTRFRTYFKRTDSYETQMETFCNLINIPNSPGLVDLMVNNKYDVFFAKCLYEKAGMKDLNNIKTIIDTLHDAPSSTQEFFYFCSKFQGDFTDYYVANSNYTRIIENQRENLCKYIKTAIPYTSEDEFTAMFARSFKQHNKYWQRSLHQIATLIDLKDYSRELLRKACSYGLNKIQSDAIDLAYDKAITKNKFIIYDASEMAYEGNIDGFLFKLPIESYEVNSIAKEMRWEDSLKNAAVSVARRTKTIIFMKDDRGQCVGYLEFRGKLLTDVKVAKSMRHDNDEVLAVMKKWCKANDIRLYNCSALKIDTSLTFSF